MARQRGRRTQPGLMRPEDIQPIVSPDPNVVLPTGEAIEKATRDEALAGLTQDVDVVTETYGRPYVGPTGEVETVGTEQLGAEIEAQERFEPIDIASLGNDPEGIQQSINARLREVDSTLKDRRDPPKPLSQGDVEDVFQAGNNLIADILEDKPENKIQYTDNNEVVSYADMLSGLFPGVPPTVAGVSLYAAANAVISDPANTAVLAFPKESKEAEQKAQSRSLVEALKKVKEDEESPAVADVKIESVEGQEIAAYQHFEAGGRRLVTLAQQLAGLTPNDIESTEGSELAEKVHQHLIDKGEGVLDTYINPNTKQKTWFFRHTAKGQLKAGPSKTLAALGAPGDYQVKLSSKTPTSFRGNVGAQPKTKADINRIQGEAILGDQVYLSSLGGVGKQADQLILNLDDQLLTEIQNQEIAKKYFKLDDKSLKVIHNNAFRKERNKLIEQGASVAEAEAAARRVADKAQDIHIKNTLSQKQYDLGLLRDLGDEVRFAEWGLGSNHRAQIQSRDLQNEHKDTIRAVINFSEKASIQKTESSFKGLDKKLPEIVSKGGRTREGFEMREAWNRLPQQDRWKIGFGARLAHSYIGLKKAASPTFIDVDGKEREVNLKRMPPASLIKYFVDNEETILGTLADLGRKVTSWEENGIDFNDPDTGELLVRGEMPYFVRAATDALNWVAADDGTHVKMEGRIEIDQSNSNVIIQSLKTGNKGAASTLGFDIDPEDLDSWFTDPDSFYTILGLENYEAVNIVEGDEDKRFAMAIFLDDVQREGAKENTRSMLVEGFYGLHPIVNSRAAKDIFAAFPEAHEALLEAYNGDEQAMLDKVLAMRAESYNSTLAKVSTTKLMKDGGALLTIGGDTTFSLESDTGAAVKFGLGELTPEYLEDMVFEMGTEGRYMAAPKMLTYKDSEGREIPSLGIRKRIDYEKSKYDIDDNGDIKDLTKAPGIAIGDSLSAIMTHASDAALMKVSNLAQNMGRETSMPNDPIHDANQLNDISFVDHWIAYHHIGLPSIAKKGNTYTQLYDKVMDHYDRKKSEWQQGGPVVPMGTDSDNRTIFGILDYHYRNLKSPQIDVADPAITARRREKNKETEKLLNKAMELGWIPKDAADAKDRQNLGVSKAKALALLELVYQMQGFLPMPGKRSSKMEKLVNKWKANNDEMNDRISKGLYRASAQT